MDVLNFYELEYLEVQQLVSSYCNGSESWTPVQLFSASRLFYRFLSRSYTIFISNIIVILSLIIINRRCVYYIYTREFTSTPTDHKTMTYSSPRVTHYEPYSAADKSQWKPLANFNQSTLYLSLSPDPSSPSPKSVTPSPLPPSAGSFSSDSTDLK